MIATDGMLISLGWTWRCLACGEGDGAFVRKEDAEESAIRHHNECEGAS